MTFRLLLLNLIDIIAFLPQVVRANYGYEGQICKKEMEDKSFAAGVDRTIIQKGVEMLNLELEVFFTDTIMGMREVADKIGLQGDNSYV